MKINNGVLFLMVVLHFMIGVCSGVEVGSGSKVEIVMHENGKITWVSASKSNAFMVVGVASQDPNAILNFFSKVNNKSKEKLKIDQKGWEQGVKELSEIFDKKLRLGQKRVLIAETNVFTSNNFYIEFSFKGDVYVLEGWSDEVVKLMRDFIEKIVEEEVVVPKTK